MLNKSLITLLITAPFFSWAQTQYTVRKGDTLLKIADKNLNSSKPNDRRRYELAKKIQSLNPSLKNPNVLEPGQVIAIPGQSKAEVVEKPVVLAPLPEKREEPVPSLHVVAEPEPAPVSVQIVPAVIPEKPVAPVPTVKKEEKHDEHKNFIFVQPRIQTLQIETKEIATETKAKMKSDSSLGLDLQYGLVLNDRFHLLFQAGMTQTEFSNIEGDGASVNHKSETLKSFAIGVGYKAAANVHLDLMLMYADRTFLLPDTAPAYLLEAVALPGAELNISWDVVSVATHIFGMSVIAEYIGELKKDDVDYKSTLDPVVALYWKSNRGQDRTNYKMTLMYKKGHQDTSLTQQKEDVTSFGVGFYF